MRFKSLEVTGFKSFAERTKINFQPGITAIVGPNGCGKSNISDAIRWVLGEQSAKQIRGEKMEDIIFNGTPNRMPMGMGEVNLIVKDLGADSANDFSAFDEVQITRRYYRSGESEYLINRIPCRLSDIRELFMDTGMGAKAYSIIGQESIATMLNSKPKERRYLFEEAAGISKYKARKDEALRKLERTQENLSRVRDIIAEVTRQRNSLNRQAKKAERYKQFKDEIKGVELHLSSHEYAALQDTWNELERQFHENKNRETELLSLSSARESQIEDLELEVLDREKQLRELEEEVRRIEGNITREENRVEVMKGEISHLHSNTDGARKEIDRLREEIGQVEEDTRRLEEERRLLTENNTERERVLQEKVKECDALNLGRGEDERKIEQGKGRLADLSRQIGILKNRIENLLQQKNALLELHNGYDLNRAEQIKQLSESQRLLLEKEEELHRLKNQVDAQRENYHAVRRRLEKKQDDLTSVMENFSHLRELIGQESSRLETLTELQENLEGYDEGVRSLVRKASSDAATANLPEIHSLVADIFETDPQVEVAIEAAISNRYQSLVINDLNDALRSVEHLKENQIGRGSFIPLQPKNRKGDPFVIREGTGVVGEALNLVRFNPRYQGVAEYLLGNVVVMEDLEQAVALFRSNGFHRTLVTLNGEVLDPFGAVEGGVSKKKAGGFIRRKREIRELRISLQVLKDQLREAVEERDHLQGEIARIKEEQNNVSASLEELEHHRLEGEKETASLRREVEYLGRKIDGLSQENETRSTEIIAIEASLHDSQEELDRLQTEHEATVSEVSQMLKDIDTLRATIEEKRGKITEERVQIAGDREKSAALLSHTENNRKNLENLRNLITAREREIEEAGNRIGRIEEERQQVESQILSWMGRKEEVQGRFAQDQDIFETKKQELSSAHQAFKEVRRETEALNLRLHNLEVKRTEQSMKREQLLTRIEEKYRISLQEVFSSYLDRELDRPAAAERLEELNRKIEQMGPVNIMAIEEYNALQERFDFLTTQEADLQESVTSLMTAIRKINRTSRQRFQEAFNAINEKFKTVFTALFQGGQAELKLEEGEDILDAGVEIVVQPPGKKLQHLSLLSGGEKALTAVALLFAGFLVKPSPFCLLDEVDAPLDDANVTRYTELLKQMTENTQFIVITHNKNTMEQADALYGITMQEPGISKMVSVRFNDGHEAQLSA